MEQQRQKIPFDGKRRDFSCFFCSGVCIQQRQDKIAKGVAISLHGSLLCERWVCITDVYYRAKKFDFLVEGNLLQINWKRELEAILPKLKKLDLLEDLQKISLSSNI